LDTYNDRVSKISINYAWSGCIIKSEPSNMPQGWTKFFLNHEYFTSYRKVMLLRHNKPVDAFALGVKSLPRNLDVPESPFKQIKKD
jgi:hypothetical protein